MIPMDPNRIEAIEKADISKAKGNALGDFAEALKETRRVRNGNKKKAPSRLRYQAQAAKKGYRAVKNPQANVNGAGSNAYLAGALANKLKVPAALTGAGAVGYKAHEKKEDAVYKGLHRAPGLKSSTKRTLKGAGVLAGGGGAAAAGHQYGVKTEKAKGKKISQRKSEDAYFEGERLGWDDGAEKGFAVGVDHARATGVKKNDPFDIEKSLLASAAKHRGKKFGIQGAEPIPWASTGGKYAADKGPKHRGVAGPKRRAEGSRLGALRNPLSSGGGRRVANVDSAVVRAGVPAAAAGNPAVGRTQRLVPVKTKASTDSAAARAKRPATARGNPAVGDGIARPKATPLPARPVVAPAAAAAPKAAAAPTAAATATPNPQVRGKAGRAGNWAAQNPAKAVGLGVGAGVGGTAYVKRDKVQKNASAFGIEHR